MPEIKLGKTKISESQIAAVILNVFLFSLPFFDVVLTMVQMQAGSAILAGIAIFAFNQRSKDKVKQYNQTIRALDAVGRANEIIRLSEEAKDAK